MLRFSKIQPAEWRVSDLPFPRPVFDSDRIANVLWLLDNNPTGQALLPAEYHDEAAPRFAATAPAANDRTIAESISARLAGETAADAGQEFGGMPPQKGQSLLVQNSPASPAPRQTGVSEAEMRDFFEQHYDLVNKVASRYGIDPALMLGLSALESTWGTHHFATQLNNPIGRTPDGKTPTKFKSFDEAWEKWGTDHGPRVQGLGDDSDAFLDRLLYDNRTVYGPRVGGDRRGAYNSVNPNWKTEVGSVIRSVQRRLPQWLATRRNVP